MLGRLYNPLAFPHFRPPVCGAWRWPLHAKAVARTTWVRLDGVICERWRQRWEYFVRFFRFADVYRTMAVGGPSPCALGQYDIEVLLSNSLIESCDETEVEGWVHCFSVPEPSKRRRRWIADPKMVNATFEVQQTMRFTLPSVDQCCRAILHGPCAGCVDLKAFYHQLPLDADVRRKFCFRDPAGKLWRLTTVPTGHRFVPGVAQAIIESLCEGFTCLVTCFIDNIRLIGEYPNVVGELRLLYARAVACGLTFNESLADAIAGIGPVYDFLGVSYNHVLRTVALTSKNVGKLRHCADALVGNPTWVMAQGIFSLAGWCSRILGLPLCRVYYVIKFMRRRNQAATPPDAPAQVWHSILPLWLSWIEELRMNRPRYIDNPTAEAPVLFTDASFQGWGAVLFDDGVQISAGRWPNQLLACNPTISELEARALLAALQGLGSNCTEIHVRIDNTGVIGSLRRTCSRNFFINDVIRHILEHRCKILSCSYVQSALNPADAPSRGAQLDAAQLRRILGLWEFTTT